MKVNFIASGYMYKQNAVVSQEDSAMPQ